jgi:hypothetical protein
VDEITDVQRAWVDAPEVEEFLFEFRAGVVDACADVASFGAEEEIGNQLGAVDLAVDISQLAIEQLKRNK